MAKLQPAVRHLRYILTHNPDGNGDDSHFIDLAKDLSAVNRRFYRQGKEYHVAGVTIHDTDANPTWVKIGVAPNTWVTRNAWYKGFKLWTAMNEQVTEEPTATMITPKYHDFKVYLNRNHRTHEQAGTDVSGPRDLYENEVGVGDWDYSSYFLPAEGGSASPDHDETAITLLGPSDGSLGAFTTVGLIAGYEQTRAAPATQEPFLPHGGTVDQSWMTNLFDTGDTFDDITESLTDDNDAPPYAIYDYPGGANVGTTNAWTGPAMVGQAFTTSTFNVSRIGPFSAICGLIEIVTRNTSSPNTIGVTIELMPGRYKGVAATAIKQ